MSETCPKCGSGRASQRQEWWLCDSVTSLGAFIQSDQCRLRQIDLLEAKLAAATKRADEAEAVQAEWKAANTPFPDADPRIEVYQNEGRNFYHCRVGGGDTAPFRTWREAYRHGEGIIDWQEMAAEVADLKAKLAAAEQENARLREILAVAAHAVVIARTRLGEINALVDEVVWQGNYPAVSALSAAMKKLDAAALLAQPEEVKDGE